MIKQLVLQVTNELPDNATLDEIFDAILVRIAVQKGLNDIENGNVISHEDLLKEIETWQ
ncbi:MAG: hypothetical protein J6M02_03600 [Clostridia bacterium]|nr:hypothetical protein [Clostridia bacterium]